MRRKWDLSYFVGGNVNWCSHCGNQYKVLQIIKNRTTIWSSISTSQVFIQRKRKQILKDICNMLIETLFTKGEIWKQSKCPLMDEWINTMWSIHIMQCYSVLKGRKFWWKNEGMHGLRALRCCLGSGGLLAQPGTDTLAVLDGGSRRAGKREVLKYSPHPHHCPHTHSSLLMITSLYWGKSSPL